MQYLLLVEVAHGIGELLGHMEDDRLWHRSDAALSFADMILLIILVFISSLISLERPSSVNQLRMARVGLGRDLLYS